MTWFRWLSSDLRGLWLAALALIVVACQPAPPLTDSDPSIAPDTAPPALRIAHGRAWEAPSVLVEADGSSAMVAWAEGDSVRARDLRSGAEATIPALFAHRVNLYRAGGGMAHILWLGTGDDPADGVRLYGLTLDVGLNPFRPAQAISDLATTDYSALAQGDGSLWVVWSGGLAAEQALYAQVIDATGRAQLPAMIQADATQPRFLRDGDGRAWLIYRRDSSADRIISQFAGGTLSGRRVVLAEPRLPFGDRVTGFSVAADSATAYAFWNVSAPDGTAYTLWSYGGLGEGENQRWRDPQPFNVTVDPVDSPPTGFNTGGQLARLDRAGVVLGWVMPLGDAGDTLPVAGVLAGEWVIAYLRGGAVFALTPVFPVDGTPISAPALVADRQRHLYVGWAGLPGDDDSAALWLWSTRR